LNAKNLSSWNFKVSKNWNQNLPSSGLKDLYIKNVLNFKIKNSMERSRYKIEDLKLIEAHDRKQLFDMSSPSMAICRETQVEIIFDMSVPKIKFNLKKECKETFDMKSDLLRYMVEFAEKNGHFSEFGSHICLKMGNEFEAYIRIAADKFYALHPHRDSFLTNFRNADDYFET